MKGYETSTDYEALWSLINSGHRIPAWIKREHGDVLAEVKFRGRPMIGTPGISYEGWGEGFHGFQEDCISLQLRYIIPSQTT